MNSNTPVMYYPNATSLTNTMYLNNAMFFGMRSRQEDVNLRWGDIKNFKWRKFLEYPERSTKTRNGVTGENRAFTTKMFEDRGNPRCPVYMYQLYAEKRPDQMKLLDSPFTLG
ncbi:LOW QUALITY PROTEIN: hypothetical protein KUTeg_011236 [Tegillarca granosa]|uniref:Uncharacterized protein n=1 Tax=Tegillarca granosa TaxID=220873 RepID=A0ABQ9F1D2_TEGGR|nr:LOW QUALITY PROTEIN: hypothetical protein KUTeg_011236 [Tegillarca granosa]